MSSKSFVLSSLISQRKQKAPLKSSLKSSSSSRSKSKSKPTPSSKPSTRIRADQLSWKQLPTVTDDTASNEKGTFDMDEGGVLLLEEVEGVDVRWEEDEQGRRKAVLMSTETSQPASKKSKRAQDDTPLDDADGIKVEEVSETSDKEDPEEEEFISAFPKEEPIDLSDLEDPSPELAPSSSKTPTLPVYSFPPDLLPSWKPLSDKVHPVLLKSLYELGFWRPTDIQKKSLEVLLGTEEGGKRDLVGVAETGSGKTLAYSLPILNHLLHTLASPEQEQPSPNGKRQLSALVLCPTRELALQVGKVIGSVVQTGIDSITAENDGVKVEVPSEDEEEEKMVPFSKKRKFPSKKPKKVQKPVKPVQQGKGPKAPPVISVATVVGGLSAVKQKRLLARGCDVLVATPGRLWDLIEEDDSFASQIKRIKFLVIDEADRMIETGHFAELENIVGLTVRSKEMQTTNASADDPTFAKTLRKTDTTLVRADMQTFIFSATLSKDLQGNLKRGNWRRNVANKKKEANTLDDLFGKLDFRDEKPEVIDLSPQGRLVATLRESMVECLTMEKDLYLYYFLLRYPGRSLVFVGSIDGIRRLVPLFDMLKVPVYPLHSQLQQKQRLKNLDRFASSTNGVLIATDVAARGLDIPSVDHVIHFQLPRTADAYIHRSGRTARAKQDGFSLQMVSPEERGMQKALMKSLDRTPDLPELAIEPGFLPKLKERIQIAKEIEKAQHQVKKTNHDRNWLKEVAEAMDVDIDPDVMSDLDDEDGSRSRNKNKQKPSDTKLYNLKGELNELLRQPLMARGVSARYPTSGSRSVVDDLLNSTNHSSLLGASTAKAFEDVDSRPAKKARKFIKKTK